jgi:hypothetical protein
MARAINMVMLASADNVGVAVEFVLTYETYEPISPACLPG